MTSLWVSLLLFVAVLSCGSPQSSFAVLPSKSPSDPAVAQNETVSGEASTTSKGLPALSIRNSRIYDSSGNYVRLRGVNLGGWLVLENWMCGITDSNDANQVSGAVGRFSQDTLEARFGAGPTRQLLDAWQDNFLTSHDFSLLQSWNVNLVRVPFSYRTLQNADGSWRLGADGNIDMSRLDWLVSEAAKNNIYVVLVFHIWDSQNLQYARISQSTSDGAADRQRAAKIWTAVATHFRGNTAIAGFDLINEPTGSPGNILQNTLYKAVTASDPNRLIIFESVSSNPNVLNWTNAIYSFHEYNMKGTDANTNRDNYAADANKFALWQNYPVPVYIGEFMAQSANDNSTLDYMLTNFERASMPWTSWTYKGVNVGGWALCNYPTSMRVNVNSDSFETILNAWSSMPNAIINQQALARYRPYFSSSFQP